MANFEYDETGNTYNYVFLTFIGTILFPSTYCFLFSSGDGRDADDEKRKTQLDRISARNSVYWHACNEKYNRLMQKDGWQIWRRRLYFFLLLMGWGLFVMIIFQISQFDYEMANFDPYEILQVSFDSSEKEIKRKYREMSLKYHPDKPTGDEKMFMKLTKAYNALTDETARYNWEHYGNPDGPQAMQFGIGLPAWIVEEKNSIWVLGIYTFIFMICLPTAVYYWWSNSMKFSGEQVLLDTSQLYYYFFHKTPHMMLKRVLMVLAASLEFEKGHNPDIVERPTDNAELPWLMKSISNLGLNNKEKPLCFVYSIKARAILFAHLSRISLPLNTLHQDRLYIIKKCPYLVNEMVSCIAQLILLAHAGRISRIPSLDTIESAMKLSSMIVQGLWDKSSPLLQLPHIKEDMLKHLHVKKKSIKSFQQLTSLTEDERRIGLDFMSDGEYCDVLNVLKSLPLITMNVTTEVVDDDEQHIVTAGSIITITLLLNRKPLLRDEKEDLDEDDLDDDGDDVDANDIDDHHFQDIHSNVDQNKGSSNAGTDCGNNSSETNNNSSSTNPQKTPVWMKKDKRSSGGGTTSKHKNKQKQKTNHHHNQQQSQPHQQSCIVKDDNGKGDEINDELSNGVIVESSDVQNENNEENVNNIENDVDVDILNDEDDEAEWARFQKRIKKREKVLEGKVTRSHVVHSPFFSDEKQEYWWVYVADRKNHALVTPPNLITSLVDHQEVELKFSAPHTPGHYSFSICVRSDSYLGLDVIQDIKLDVTKAKKVVEEHPQWQFEDSDISESEDDSDSDSDDEKKKSSESKNKDTDDKNGNKKNKKGIDDDDESSEFATDSDESETDEDDYDDTSDGDH